MTNFVIVGPKTTEEQLKTAIYFLNQKDIVICLATNTPNFYIDIGNYAILDFSVIEPLSEGKVVYLNLEDFNIIKPIISKKESILICRQEDIIKIEQDISHTEVLIQKHNKQIRKAKNAELQPILGR